MSVVFSFWYIVAVILALGSVGCFVAFFLMDKKDKQIMQDFAKSNAEEGAKENESKGQNE